MIEKQDVIIIAPNPGKHSIWYRRRYVAYYLSKRNRVLFIQPPFTIFSLVTAKVSWKHLFSLGRLVQKNSNYFIYSPLKIFPASLPFNKIINWNNISKKIIVKNIRRIIIKTKIINPILWVYFDEIQYDYYGEFGEKLVVVDWYDKHSANSGSTSTDWVKKAMEVNKNIERRLIENADVIFAASKLLKKELKSEHKKVYHVSNGVDFEYFENYDYSHDLPLNKYEDMKRPILAFLGMMHYIVDFELLNYVADENLEWNVLLMGHNNLSDEEDKKQFKKLINRKNVVYTGLIKKTEIPYYLNFADVCLLPMKKIAMNKYADPLKLWEYFASGKPVVAVNQGEDYSGKGLIYMADNRNQFIDAISKALAEGNDSTLRWERKQIAKQNSWDKKVDEMIKYVEKEISK